jgi:hypothetical protein
MDTGAKMNRSWNPRNDSLTLDFLCSRNTDMETLMNAALNMETLINGAIILEYLHLYPIAWKA